MRKCKHEYTARLHQHTTYPSVELRDAALPSTRSTDLIKVCTKCGIVEIESFRVYLYPEDFANSPVADMLARHTPYEESDDT